MEIKPLFWWSGRVEKYLKFSNYIFPFIYQIQSQTANKQPNKDGLLYNKLISCKYKNKKIFKSKKFCLQLINSIA